MVFQIEEKGDDEGPNQKESTADNLIDVLIDGHKLESF